jgi:hypothetical protein
MIGRVSACVWAKLDGGYRDEEYGTLKWGMPWEWSLVTTGIKLMENEILNK